MLRMQDRPLCRVMPRQGPLRDNQAEAEEGERPGVANREAERGEKEIRERLEWESAGAPAGTKIQ